MNKRRTLAFLLAAAMCLSIVSAPALAAETDPMSTEFFPEASSSEVSTDIGVEAQDRVPEASDSEENTDGESAPEGGTPDASSSLEVQSEGEEPAGGDPAVETASPDEQENTFTSSIPEDGGETKFAAHGNAKILRLQHSGAFDYVKGNDLLQIQEEAKSYPSSFDLRHVPDGNGGEVSYVTPVKLQNPFGTCWGFAAIGAAESSLLASGLAQNDGYNANTLDLSEKQTSYFVNTPVSDPESPQHGEGTHFRNIPEDQKKTCAYRYDTGGVTFMATSLFASGVGPVLESEDDLLYRGKRGEKAYWEVATQYDDEGNPVEASYQLKPLWYSTKDDWSMPERTRYLQDFRLRDSIVLPNPAGYDENDHYQYQPEAVDAIKQQISQYHRAVCVSFCAESYLPGQDTTGKMYMSRHWAHYTNTPEYSNHAVTIVGYDDNYPRENFNSNTENGGSAMPERNGAFLVKNSWGSELNEFPTNGYRHWGLLDGQDTVPYDPEAKAKPGNKATGYFWISYYDQSLNDPEAFVFDPVTKETEDAYVGQHDLMYPKYLLHDYSDGRQMANVFETEATSRLSELSVMTTTPGTTVSYKVYLLGEGAENPEDGILIESGEHSYEYGGYHRFSLAQPRVLTKGQQYSVVIRERSENGSYVPYSAAYNTDESNLYSVSVINPGESFYYDGTRWEDLSEQQTQDDLTAYYASYHLTPDNFPIKSYLTPVTFQDGDKLSVFRAFLTAYNWQEGNSGSYTLSLGESKTLDAEFRGTGADMPASMNPVFTWIAEDESVIRVTNSTPQKGRAVLTGLKPGKTHLLVYAGDKGTAGPSGHPDNYGVIVLSIQVRNFALTSFSLDQTKLPAVYSGKAVEPGVLSVSAEDGRSDLREGVDYTVSYQNNVQAGTASVTVTGTGSYTGTLTTEFTIAKAAQSAPAAPKESKRDTKSITVETSKGLEYSLDQKNWQKSGTFSGLKAGKSYKVYARKAETANFKASPASEAVVIKTRENAALNLNSGLVVTQTGSQLNVKWGNVEDAAEYEVWAQYCGKKFAKKPTITVKATDAHRVIITSLNKKKLKLTRNFRVVVVARKGNKTLAKSITAHVVGRQNKVFTNARSIKLITSSFDLNKDETAQIKAKTVLVKPKRKQLGNGHATEFRFASSDKSVATVNASGKITAKGKGKCVIYVYARNGLARKVKVTVK